VDWSFLGVVAAAALAGVVRGFSGFGSAMVFVPIASALYSPEQAVVLLFLTDSVVSLPLLPPAFKRCIWREVAPLTIGAALLVPVGVKLLLIADPIAMRWAISLLVLSFTGLMAGGWRYVASPSVPVTVAVGGAAGLAGGMASLYGPPVILFWLGGQQDVPTVRANILAFLGLITVVSAATYVANGMITRTSLVTAAALMPLYALGIFLGARCFGLASERAFRLLALTLCWLIALGTLPIW
jgi:uncharacterized membrane protein YfcA